MHALQRIASGSALRGGSHIMLLILSHIFQRLADTALKTAGAPSVRTGRAAAAAGTATSATADSLVMTAL